jgi:hypothetical protein
MMTQRASPVRAAAPPLAPWLQLPARTTAALPIRMVREDSVVSKWTRIIIAAVILASLAGAQATFAQNEDIGFRWASSRHQDDGRVYLPKELTYRVYLQRGDEPEQQIAAVQDTFYVLSAEPDVVQRLRVQAVDAYGNASPMSEWSEPVFFTSGGDGPSALPVQAQLRGNYPNPFNPQTTISYGVPLNVAAGDPVRLDVYSLQGQLVRSFDVDRTPGWHEVIWDGTDERGMNVATGMYVTRFAVGAMVETSKMTLLK